MKVLRCKGDAVLYLALDDDVVSGLPEQRELLAHTDSISSISAPGVLDASWLHSPRIDGLA